MLVSWGSQLCLALLTIIYCIPAFFLLHNFFSFFFLSKKSPVGPPFEIKLHAILLYLIVGFA